MRDMDKVINSRISKLRQYLKILKDLSIEKKEDFVSDYRIYGLAERYLQLSIECVLDIGNHLISKMELKKPDTYHEILLILGENNILPEDFAKKIGKMAGFRNILIHNYMDVDREIVYEHLQEDFLDFKKYIRYIVSFFESS